MQIVRLALAAPPGRPVLATDAEMVNELLWSHIPPSAGVAHITTTALTDHIDVTIFLNSGTENPARRVMAMLGSIPKNSTVLGYWLEEATVPGGER